MKHDFNFTYTSLRNDKNIPWQTEKLNAREMQNEKEIRGISVHFCN